MDVMQICPVANLWAPQQPLGAQPSALGSRGVGCVLCVFSASRPPARAAVKTTPPLSSSSSCQSPVRLFTTSCMEKRVALSATELRICLDIPEIFGGPTRAARPELTWRTGMWRRGDLALHDEAAWEPQTRVAARYVPRSWCASRSLPWTALLLWDELGGSVKFSVYFLFFMF